MSTDTMINRKDRALAMLAGRHRLRAWRQARFLRDFRQSGDLGAAAMAAGVTPWSVHHWRRTDARFANAFEVAQEEALSVLETVALQRARAGSDRMLIFLLSSRWPGRYGPARLRAQETGPNTAQIAAEMQWAATQLENFCPPCPETDDVPHMLPPSVGSDG